MVEEKEEARSNTESDENSNPSSSDELETGKDGEIGGGISEYEKQRLLRIKENRARLESLGLPSLASTLLGSVKGKTTPKGKEKGKGKGKGKHYDDEYKPSDGEDRVSSSSEEDDEDDDGYYEEFQVKKNGSSRVRQGSTRKGKQKCTLIKSGTKKKLPVRNLSRNSDFVDDDEALRQAIALSLEGSSEMSAAVYGGLPQNPRIDVSDFDPKERKREAAGQKNDREKKRRKSNTSRVQITEDQMLIHFFNFDEARKGNITLEDLQSVAVCHDFSWTEKEMAAMIHCFDSDGDGKLSLDDFRKILCRCNMLQGGESSST